MISTHVLDTSLGKPAAGVGVTLERGDTVIATTTTNADGRVTGLVPTGAGAYRLTFDVAAYFGATKAFYHLIRIDFEVGDAEQHYHVPLLLSPFGYSTYRGS